MITEITENQIFVFGSNLYGHHAGGAAKQAHEDFGAIWGIGVGRQGKCYAIPTMSPLTLKEIYHYIKEFIEYARLHPHLKFLVTPIGTGIAGYSGEQMNELWGDDLPINVIRL